MRDASGVTTSFSTIMRYLTERRREERRRDMFVSVASHELRTPMTAIIGFTELLLDREWDAKTQRQWLKLIDKEGHRMASILDDLLNASHIHSGTLSLTFREIDLASLVEEVVIGIRVGTVNHTFVIDTPEGLSPVLADQDKLTAVLANLLENAVKYSPQGGRITVAAVEEGDRGRVVLSVADEGIGIAPEDCAEVFTSFYRISRPETENIHGSGLGLYIVEALTEMLDGKVWIDSVLDEGSTFFVALPLAAAPKVASDEAA